MNMFRKIKMGQLLNRRYKLKAELMALDDQSDMSAERSVRISNLKSQIMSINAQIDELVNGEQIKG